MLERNSVKPLFENLSLDGKPLVIAGPCSAETESQLAETAEGLRKNGISIFRAGIWKPRTKPGGFEGVGEKALEWLDKVKQQTGMLTATEVATRHHVKSALDAGIDLLWIGARTSANPFAMQEIAEAIADIDPDTPVLVKNPLNPDLELWIGAMQRLYEAGIARLGAVHRGFSSYGKHQYRNLPEWHIPIELKRRWLGLPVINDPSHITGNSGMVETVSQQALDMGFNGLMIETHCDPANAWSDREQQITPAELGRMLGRLELRNNSASVQNIEIYRQQIDALDSELIELLGKRMDIACEIGKLKKANGLQVIQPARYDNLMNARLKQGVEIGMSRDFMVKLLSAIHEESVRRQLGIVNRKTDIEP